jgi:hypothetical protein
MTYQKKHTALSFSQRGYAIPLRAELDALSLACEDEGAWIRRANNLLTKVTKDPDEYL